jgi:hypothetical protein
MKLDFLLRPLRVNDMKGLTHLFEDKAGNKRID